ncbi:MAG TPA: hypothetical protein VF405_14380 [Gammaproteobacteria bacterium]
METHATRVVVWDVPVAVEPGAVVRVKVGVKCAAECSSAGRLVEIRDAAGCVVASGSVGETPWPGTSALFHTELELRAPSAEGLHVRDAFVVPAVDEAGEPMHEAASARFQIRAVRAPECRLRVIAVDARSHLPVAGAKVVVHPYHALTNADGVAELRVPRGPYRLFVSGRDRFPFRTDGEIDADVTIQAELDEDFGPSDAELWS